VRVIWKSCVGFNNFKSEEGRTELFTIENKNWELVSVLQHIFYLWYFILPSFALQKSSLILNAHLPVSALQTKLTKHPVLQAAPKTGWQSSGNVTSSLRLSTSWWVQSTSFLCPDGLLCEQLWLSLYCWILHHQRCVEFNCQSSGFPTWQNNMQNRWQDYKQRNPGRLEHACLPQLPIQFTTHMFISRWNWTQTETAEVSDWLLDSNLFLRLVW
jgi:hypothetical protein